MRAGTHIRPVGRTLILCAVASIGLVLTSARAVAGDPIETQVAPVVAAIVDQVNAVTCPIRSTTGCPIPIPNPNVKRQPDLTSAQVAIAIGNITQDLAVSGGDPSALTNLLGHCQPYLEQFIGNTEYLGPLLDYGLCLETNGAPAVIATLPRVTGGVNFLAGVCSLVTNAYEYYSYSYPYGTSVAFSGTTDCTAGSSTSGDIFAAWVTANASLENSLYNQTVASAPSAGGSRYARSAGTMYSTISYATGGGIAKNRLKTEITPESPVCTANGLNCGFHWVVLADKSPDTGTSLSCNQLALSSNLLCVSNGIPVTDSTVAQR